MKVLKTLLPFLVVLVVAQVAIGCSIQVNGDASYPKRGTPPKPRSKAPARNTPPSTPKEEPAPKEDPAPKKGELIQGYATLTFYPGEANSSLGTLGGYVLLFDKPQPANDPFSEVPVGSCRYTEHPADKKRPPQTYAGLDLGKEVSLSVGSQRWSLGRTLMDQSKPEEGFFYNLTTVQDLTFPFERPFSFASTGGPSTSPLSLKAASPSRLTITAPDLRNEGTLVSRTNDLVFRYRFESPATSFVVRINQSNQSNTLTRSLTCRYKNTGSATIPANSLKPFAVDEDGSKTSLFVFSGAYKRTPVKGYKAPVYAVVESITYTPAIVQP